MLKGADWCSLQEGGGPPDWALLGLESADAIARRTCEDVCVGRDAGVSVCAGGCRWDFGGERGRDGVGDGPRSAGARREFGGGEDSGVVGDVGGTDARVCGVFVPLVCVVFNLSLFAR